MFDHQSGAMGLGPVAKAKSHGFGRRDLTDPHQAIALITGRTYARANGQDEAPKDVEIAEISMAALAYEGGEPAPVLACAITGLPSLGEDGLGALRDIATLLRLFARFTHSHPDGTAMADWRNEIEDISVTLAMGLDWIAAGRVKNGKLALDDATERLVARLPHLWS